MRCLLIFDILKFIPEFKRENIVMLRFILIEIKYVSRPLEVIFLLLVIDENLMGLQWI